MNRGRAKWKKSVDFLNRSKLKSSWKGLREVMGWWQTPPFLVLQGGGNGEACGVSTGALDTPFPIVRSTSLKALGEWEKKIPFWSLKQSYCWENLGWNPWEDSKNLQILWTVDLAIAFLNFKQFPPQYPGFWSNYKPLWVVVSLRDLEKWIYLSFPITVGLLFELLKFGDLGVCNFLVSFGLLQDNYSA